MTVFNQNRMFSWNTRCCQSCQSWKLEVGSRENTEKPDKNREFIIQICLCNNSGRCLSCSCIKLGKCCIDWLPSCKGQCCKDVPALQKISTPLIGQIIIQDHRLDGCHAIQQSIKIRIQHNKPRKQKGDAENIQRTQSIHHLTPAVDKHLVLSTSWLGLNWIWQCMDSEKEIWRGIYWCKDI